MKTAVWAHKGASAHAPENTLPAFALAQTLGADGVELDVHRTADGRLVVIHDETIDARSNGTGAIVDMTYDELRCFDFSAGQQGYENTPIPLLDEVFELLEPSGMTVNVELKTTDEFYPGMEAQAHQLAVRMGMADRVIYSSFNHYTLRDLQQAVPTARLGLLYGEALVDIWDYAQRFGAHAIHPYWPVLQVPGLVERCHEFGIAVHAWTVDDPEQMRRLAELQVDAIITNTPDVCRRVIDEVFG